MRFFGFQTVTRGKTATRNTKILGSSFATDDQEYMRVTEIINKMSSQRKLLWF